jgi:DNA-binding LacI/PurR family transcriptional regulator
MSKITVKDLAKKAGVSTATVSRVLRKQGPISEKTESLVMQAARELNFAIPAAGWKSRPAVHRQIGMLIAGIEGGLEHNSFFVEVVMGASSEANRRNLSISIAPLTIGSLPAMVHYNSVDGLIVAGVPIPDEQIITLGQLPVPTVFIGRYLDHTPLSYVSPENLEGGRIAALHLKELGHRKIAILSGLTSIKTFNDRLRGAQKVFRDCEPPQVILSDTFDETAGYEAMADLLTRGEVPTAVLSLSDWMAFGALRCMRERGLRVPEDISVVGFSDLPTAGMIDPPLTTIHIPQRRLGSLAVHLVHALIEGDIAGPVGMMVPLALVQRASTAAPRRGKID